MLTLSVSIFPKQCPHKIAFQHSVNPPLPLYPLLFIEPNIQQKTYRNYHFTAILLFLREYKQVTRSIVRCYVMDIQTEIFFDD